ncbi:MAG: ABC transporter ATP-binding protein, partial [Candidatus Omnitrophica bacterium]|nr:ABC transporter ATP-binding protein [Candidatus Omnitrophota bacterium]
MDVITFRNVWEMFRIKFVIDKKVSWDNFWALKDISFGIKKGETVGLIGENGAGKSTILKLIAGILHSDRGEINVTGRVAGLLELGAGFQPELTGRDNIYLNTSLFGLSDGETKNMYEKIVDFAALGKFIHAPVKCYSQGMFVRLAFAIAIHINPDILLIDDTLAVGDEFFQRKCVRKVFQLKERGTTIVFVSHDANMIQRLCSRVILLKEGRLIKDDAADKVIPLYTQMIGARGGVGILEKNFLKVVFNNGRVFLNWQDKLLTPNSAAYTVFFIANKWYSSLQADWKVEKESGNKLVATGKFYQLALTQTWKLELIDDYTIKWNIEMESQEPLEVQEGYINIMVANDYTRWCTTLEQGDFPPIIEKDRDWFPLIESNIRKDGIGVEKSAVSGNIIPSLIFQHLESPFSCDSQILNGDYFTNCRILQYKTAGLQNYSRNYGSCFPYFSGKIIVGDFSA